MAIEYKTADGYTVTLSQIAQVFGVRETQKGKVADVLLTGAILPVSLLLDVHPADVAFDLEAPTEAEAQAAAVERDNQWLSDTVREAYDFTPFPTNMPDIDFENTDGIPF